MASIVVAFPKSYSQSQAKIVKLPFLKNVKTVTTDNGNVTYTLNGNDITVTVYNGASAGSDYQSNGYTDTKQISTQRYFPEIAGSCDSSVNYTSADGYSNPQLPNTACFHNTSLQRYEGTYSGTGYKWIDTSGYTPYYFYNVTITYDELTPATIVAPNGGETLSAPFDITILPSSDGAGLANIIELSTDNGVTWAALGTIQAGNTKLNYDFLQATETSLALIRSRYSDGTNTAKDFDTSNGVFTIIHNAPPSMPTNLSPSSGVIDRSKVQRFSWKHNDPNSNDRQSKAVLQWKLSGASTWNVVNVNSPDNFYDFNSNTFPLGDIVWQVKTYDQTNLEGPFSNVAIFTASDPAGSPTILTPATNTVAIARPAVSWSSIQQIAYQIVITDLLNNVIYDTGEVVSTNKAQTIAYDLLNGGNYVLKVRVKSNAGLWSSYTTKNISVSYTQPAKPTIVLEIKDVGTAISITNPSPTGTQPSVTAVDVYRKEGENDWKRIAANVGNYFVDYTQKSKTSYQYKVRVYGSNTTFIESDIINSLFVINNMLLALVNDYNSYVVLKYGTSRQVKRQRQSNYASFAGREDPVLELGEQKALEIEVSLEKLTDSEIAKLESFSNGSYLLYRDSKGRKEFVSYTEINVVDTISGLYNANLKLTKVSYNEEVL